MLRQLGDKELLQVASMGVTSVNLGDKPCFATAGRERELQNLQALNNTQGTPSTRRACEQSGSSISVIGDTDRDEQLTSAAGMVSSAMLGGTSSSAVHSFTASPTHTILSAFSRLPCAFPHLTRLSLCLPKELASDPRVTSHAFSALSPLGPILRSLQLGGVCYLHSWSRVLAQLAAVLPHVHELMLDAVAVSDAWADELDILHGEVLMGSGWACSLQVKYDAVLHDYDC